MMFKNSLIACLLLICAGQISSVSKQNVFCFYESWFAYPSHGNGTMNVKDFDNSACTHRVYGYMGVSPKADLVAMDETLVKQYHQIDDWGRSKGRDLSLIAIGGNYELSASMKYAVEQPLQFAVNVIAYLNQHNLDGLVLDTNLWFPRDNVSGYVNMLLTLRKVFANKYVLAAIVGRSAEQALISVIGLADFAIVNTYDYHGLWENYTGHASSLFDQSKTMSEWVKTGAPSDKLIMTLPFFGRSWTLVNEKQNGVGAPAKGPGSAGLYTFAPGKLGYNEMAVALKNASAGWIITTYGDNSWQYATKGDQWVSYETPATCETKAKWVASNGFAGVAAMAVNNDDFNALASPIRHPLLTAVNKGLHS